MSDEVTAIAEAKRLLSEGDARRASARLKTLEPSRVAPEHLAELALMAIEQDALDLATQAMAHAADATHPTYALVRELLALQPKIPASYLHLFAEGTRTGLTDTLRAKIGALKKRNVADATEVFGQLGLRAPKLRKTYGSLVDPLLSADGTPPKAPWHWGWLAGGLAVVLFLAKTLAKLSGATSSAPLPSIDVEVAEDGDAMLHSAVNLICTDRPERCDDAQSLSASLEAHRCEGAITRLERLTAGDLEDASGDAIRLLQQSTQQMCATATNPGTTP